MGFDYATFSDHVVIPTDIEAKYPYSNTGEFPAGSRVERHEQLIEMAFVAAKTKKLRLVSSVMVVPHRPAVLTAKMLSTIDVLSGGRLVLGIGAGWMKEEFEAIQAPDFAERGKVTDEYIKAFIELWTKPNPKFAGKHVRFDNILMDPKPVQKPYPPIWVGGESGPALRRTAQLGDAWYPIGTNPANPLDSLKRFKTQVDAAAQDDRGGRPQGRRRRGHLACHPVRRERAGQGGRRRAPAVLRQAGRARRRHQGARATSASAASTSASPAARSMRCWPRCRSSSRTCWRWFSSAEPRRCPRALMTERARDAPRSAYD